MDALERQQYLSRNGAGRCTVRSRVRCGATFLASTLFLTFGPARVNADIGSSLNLSTEITPIVARDLAAGHVPGAVVVVSRQGQIAFRQAFGLRTAEPAPVQLRADDIFDLASLTKVIATTTAIMQLVEQGRIQLDAPAATYWPEFAANSKGAITIRQLLTHTSGLAPDLDLSTSWRGQDDGLARTAAARTIRAPGTAFLYSDINFIVLGEIVARVSGEPLDTYVQDHVFKPLGMTTTGFRPPASSLDRIVATDREQGHLRWGEVQDPTAYRMGGVAGHAGLFSTADDLARFATMLLRGGELDGARILQPGTVALMTQAQALPGGTRRGLGWDMASPYSQGLDQWFGPTSFGHTGYTGCLMWIDPATQSYLIVLTSRLHPDGVGDVKPLRQDLGRLVGTLIRSRS